jgi:hypothetical protein
MSSVVDSAFTAAHESVAEMRQGVASTEVALGVADRALGLSERLLNDADKGLDVLEQGVDTSTHAVKIALIGAGIVIAVGAGVVFARRRNRTLASTDPYYAYPGGETGAEESAEANPA